MGKSAKLTPEKQAISDRLNEEIKSKYGLKKNLAQKLNKDLPYLSRIVGSGSYSMETRNILIAAGIDMDYVEGFNEKVINGTVIQPSPAPAISPPIPTDCEKISAEMETVRGMMEFYRSELEKAKNEIIALYKDKVDLREQVARLEADARQPVGRSMVERGNTANASDYQKIIA